MFRILVADDEERFLDGISRILIKAGYDVTTAGDGIEPMDRYNESCFDAVVTDLAMPRATGYELARHIHNKAKDTTPVLIGMTGMYMGMDRNCFDMVLDKPFSAVKLVEYLKDFEDKRK